MSDVRDSSLPETVAETKAREVPSSVATTEDATVQLSSDTHVERIAPAVNLDRGQKVGRYVVLEALGAGGMGVVYRAYDPDLDRHVALKVISPRASSDGTTESRLYREAQALARLAHENVVAVHDVGTYEGRIFVAMELVAGQTLNRWLRADKRTRADILRAFHAAGRGLAAAHAAGLVHRDFKPTNVMIGDDGRVRVLDFGLARAAGEDERMSITSVPPTDPANLRLLSSPLTAVGMLVGTPHYMAPEQLRRGGGSARSDQYCFCVSLWEALCGRRPFSAANVEQLLLRLESGQPDPLPPEVKLPNWLRRVLLRGLAPDPEARFPSMDALLAELERDPARRVRRYGGMALAAVVTGLAVALVMSVVRRDGNVAARCEAAGTPVGTLWNAQARTRLRASFAQVAGPYGAEATQRVERALDAYAGAWSEMSRAACRAVYVEHRQSEALLDRRSVCLERRRAGLAALLERFDQPDVATVTSAVTAALALPAIADCGDLETLSRGPSAPTSPKARGELARAREAIARADARRLSGQMDAALTSIEPWQARVDALHFAPVAVELRELLAELRAAVPGRYGEAEPTLDEAMRLAAESGDDRAQARLWVTLLGIVGNDLGRPAEALALRRAAELAFTRANVLPGDPQRADLVHNVALAAWRAGRSDEALARCEEALLLRERALGPAHHAVGNSLTLLAILLGEAGDLDGAARAHERALTVRRAALGENHPFVADSLDNLGVIRQEQGRVDEALALHEQSLALRERVLGPDHTDVGTSLNNVGALRLELGDVDAAERLFARVASIWERSLAPGDISLAIVLINQGEVALARGDAARAREACQRALTIESATVPADSPSLAWQLTCLGEAETLAGRPREGLDELERALVLRKDELPADRARSEYALAHALERAGGERARAITLARAALESFTSAGEIAKRRRALAEKLLARLGAR